MFKIDNKFENRFGRITVKNGHLVSKLGVYKNKRLDKIVWEVENGEIPYTHTINHLDGDRFNCELSNLEMIPNAEYQVLTSIGVDLDGV